MAVCIIFCRNCRSHRVDINCWKDDETAVVRCYNCGNEGELRGFSLGRTGYSQEAIAEALEDMAEPIGLLLVEEPGGVYSD